MANKSVTSATWMVLAALTMATGAYAQEAGDPDPAAHWISANAIFIAPTTAEINGDGFDPGATLSLDVIDPLGSVVTLLVVADGAGRLATEIAVDQPGIYVARIRDANGQVLAEGEIFVGVD